MNVLSLFDGMSCGQIALNRSGIHYDNYYASEIKKHAIQRTQHNYPKTIQLGDIRNIKGSDLPKIDLLIGGSPCQDFSQANKNRTGLQGVKSGLFFEYLRLMRECKPTYYLLENVVMSDDDLGILSEYMGTMPVRINSSLVSAQLRDRYYWTNIGQFHLDMFGGRWCDIPQPKDRNIKLQDILENGFTEMNKSRTLLTSDPIYRKREDLAYKRYKNTGFTSLVFNSSNFDLLKGIRFYTQSEREVLQTVPTGYTKNIKHIHAKDLLGDGWTIDVICHIFEQGIKMNQLKIKESVSL